MQLWDIDQPSTAPNGGPQVLFSTPEARGVIVDLAAGESLGDHRVRERALIQVVRGRVELSGGDGEPGTSCDEGALALVEPGETRAVRALEDTRLLLVLAPWPGPGHYDPSEQADPHELPARATAPERLQPQGGE